MSQEMLYALLNAWVETIYMVVVSGGLGLLFGLPLGAILYLTGKSGILENVVIYRGLGTTVNAVRSIPFIILIIALIPLARLIVGTSIGSSAAIVSLTIGAIPFVARMVENSLQEVPKGLIEAGLAMGATPLQIMLQIIIPEAISGIINGATITLITLVGYSAMAGAVGGGGLGDLAMRYGYQRFDVTIMLVTIAVLIIMVQLIQWAGDFLAARLSHT